MQTDRGPVDAARVVLATGGLSVPTTGSDGGGLRIAGVLGHRVNEVYPALDPARDRAAGALGARAAFRCPCGCALGEADAPRKLEAGFSSRIADTAAHQSSTSLMSRCGVSETSERAMISAQWTTSRCSRVGGGVQLRSNGLVVNAIAEHMPQRLADTPDAGGSRSASIGVRSELRRAERSP